MIEKKVFLEKIVRLIDSPGNEELLKEVNDLRHQSAENEEFYKSITQIWDVSADLKGLNLLSVEEATARLSARLGYEEQPERSGYLWLRNVAAAVLVLVAGYWIYQSVNKPELHTVSTGSDRIDSLLLSDGSKIYLSENSAFRYPEKFRGDKREVELLKGEAYFKIARDAAHPFEVHIDTSTAAVLGTSFNIRSDYTSIQIGVTTGTVKFVPGAGHAGRILHKGAGLTYDLRSGVVKAYPIANQNCDSWLTHKIVFVDAPLAEVFSSLEKYYKVKFVQQDSFSSYNKFNAEFKNNSLDEVLDIIKETYPIEVSRKDSLVLLKSK